MSHSSFAFCSHFSLSTFLLILYLFHNYNGTTQADASAPTMMNLFSVGTNMWIDSFEPITL